MNTSTEDWLKSLFDAKASPNLDTQDTRAYLLTLTSYLFDTDKLATIVNKNVALDYLIYTLAKDVSQHRPDILENVLNVLDVAALKGQYQNILNEFIQYTLNT